MEQATLAIIKPDATARNIIGQIVRRAEEKDLKVVAMRMIHLTTKEAEGFYYVHRERPFFRQPHQLHVGGSRGGDGVAG